MMLIAWILPLFMAQAAQPKSLQTFISARLVLKVSDKNQTARSLIEAANQAGGYFITRTDHLVRLKVPTDKAEGFLKSAATFGLLLDSGRQAQDLAARLLELRTRLSSREEVFSRYFEVLHGANLESVVEVETAMTRVVFEIEELKGAIRLIEHQLLFADITVEFQFHDRRPPPRDGSSSFAWLNTLNLTDLLGEFAYED